MPSWKTFQRQVTECTACPRLREHCEQVGRDKRKSYADWEYWTRPVPDFGQAPAALLIVGLAPAAHGANRTGRIFTGDRSGDWLYRALFKAGFANQPTASDRNDGLKLIDCVITAACRCAPPDNKPTTDELSNCRRWLTETIRTVRPRVVLALGHIGWKAVLREARDFGWHTGALPKFGHGAKYEWSGGRWLLGSYHPSQQNTFTGRLTEPMFDAVFAEARRLVEAATPAPARSKRRLSYSP